MDLFNSKQVLTQNRWLWVDYDKGISIILVGYGHCLAILNGHVPDLDKYAAFSYAGSFLYGFRMPLFFIVSGLLVAGGLRKKGLTKYIANRADNILFPLLVWGFIEISLQLISARYGSSTPENNIGFYRYFQLLINPRATGHFWYLNTLFCIGVIYAAIKARISAQPLFQVVLGFMLYSLSAYIHLHDIEAGVITDISQFYIFFAIGDLISRHMLDKESVERLSTWKLFIPLLAVFIVMQYYFTIINVKHSDYSNRFVEVKMPFLFLAEALVGCATSISLSFLLQKYKLFTWIRIVGYYSLFIYVMQIITMSFAQVLFQKFLKVSYTPALIALVLLSGICLPIIFYNLCIRWNVWWLYTFKKPHKEAEPPIKVMVVNTEKVDKNTGKNKKGLLR